MDGTRFVLFVLVSVTSPIFRSVHGSRQKTLTDLRRFNVEAVVGRFSVKRIALEEELQNRKQQDVVCGHGGHSHVAFVAIEDFRPFCGATGVATGKTSISTYLDPFHTMLPHANYNITYQGEMTLVYGTITDHSLATELSNDLTEQIVTSYQYLSVEIPVVIGNKRPGVLSLHAFISGSKMAIHPYFPSMNEITKVDSIKEADNGTVSIRLGDDVMVIQVQNNVLCKDELQKNIGKDFDKLSGKVLTFTSYPLPFDWGCDLFGSQISFCQVLDEVQCELAAVGGDVCTQMSPVSSQRCPATFSVVEMTGKFHEMLPFLAEMVRSQSFKAEYFNREHTSGIRYPCLTP